jgi:hypothetical protein
VFQPLQIRGVSIGDNRLRREEKDFCVEDNQKNILLADPVRFQQSSPKSPYLLFLDKETRNYSGTGEPANTGLVATQRKKRDRPVFARTSLRLRQSLFC